MSKSCSERVPSMGTVRVGFPIGPMDKFPDRAGVVLFCAAIRNFHRLHYDEAYTRAQGIRDVLVPGFQTGNWCLEAVTGAFPRGTRVSRLKFRNVRKAYVGDRFRVAGTVTALNLGDDGTLRVVCQVDVRDGSGEVVTIGEVDAVLPPGAPGGQEPTAA